MIPCEVMRDHMNSTWARGGHIRIRHVSCRCSIRHNFVRVAEWVTRPYALVEAEGTLGPASGCELRCVVCVNYKYCPNFVALVVGRIHPSNETVFDGEDTHDGRRRWSCIPA